MVPRRKSRVAPPPSECPLRECMSLLEGAWTVNIIWYLREGPRRFGELRHDLDGVSAKTLTARLRRIEADDLLTRTGQADVATDRRVRIDGIRMPPSARDRGDRRSRPLHKAIPRCVRYRDSDRFPSGAC